MRIVISMGDPAGVGPEIIVKALTTYEHDDVAFLIIGNEYYLKRALSVTGVELEYTCVDSPDFSARVSLYQPREWEGEYAQAGEWSRATGAFSLEYVRTGVELCLKGKADAVVTAPICKSAWKEAGCEFPGHTELLGEMCGQRDEVMMLAGGGLRVALISTHHAIVEIPSLVSCERIERIAGIVNTDLVKRFGIAKPRIALLGLNPHAGEDGHLGTEELEVINPAAEVLRARGLDITDAIPADTAFHRMLRGEFDVIIAMYHDQGLGPLKTVAFDSGVNVTLGLPIIRTSVDHGTAFDIAGSGKAGAESMDAAIRSAVFMAENENRV